jgi:hypothetical protein
VNQHTQDQMDYARIAGHAVPSGEMAAIVEQAMDALVEKPSGGSSRSARSRPRAVRRRDATSRLKSGARSGSVIRAGARSSVRAEGAAGNQ